MKNAQAILFDLDGTLTDSAPGIVNSLAYMMEQMGEEAPPIEALMKYVGPPLRHNIVDLLGTERVEEGLAHYVERYTNRRMGMLENRLYEGITEVLAALVQAGKVLFVATSKHRDPSKMITDHLGLTPFFKAIHGSRAGGHLADKGELISMIMGEEGLDPARTVMIGDRHFDVEGAKKNGIPCIGALWGYGSREELEAAGAFRIAAAPGDLCGLLLE